SSRIIRVMRGKTVYRAPVRGRFDHGVNDVLNGIHMEEVVSVLGVEAVCALTVTWLWKHLRGHAGRVANLADSGIDAGLARLEQLVEQRLGADTALAKLRTEAHSGTENPRTHRRLELALQDAAESDSQLVAELRNIVDELRMSADVDGLKSAGRDLIQNTGSGSMFVHTGSGNLHAASPDVSPRGDQDG
ncbi:MAG: hypothetical protein ACRD0P_28500, partial [Stackebrandtia sp.]